mgnify:CR=1 FL=1
MKKITMATVKSFIRKNEGRLYIRTLSAFDGMTDCCERCEDRSFQPAQPGRHKETLGIAGAWFVGGSRDSLMPIEEGEFTGFHIYNCCGSFDLAIRKEV